MHKTAMTNASLFFNTYTNKDKIGGKVLEVGSQDVNGSIKSTCPNNMEYIGVDFVEGKGVDIVLNDPYKLPFEDNTFDYILSSSVFEHSEFFWELFLEILRVLKQDGIFYLNAPSNATIHRYPVDCWRFYPDSGNALVNYAKRQGLNPLLLESFTTLQNSSEEWNDFVAIFLKDTANANKYTNRIIYTLGGGFYNGLSSLEPGRIINSTMLTENQARLNFIESTANGRYPIKWY